LDTYSEFIHKSRYARYLSEQGRRETWAETVTRYCDFWKEKYPDIFPYDEVWQAIYNMEVMPSMRALMTAGKALDRDNMAGFNCSYLPVDDVRAFDEALYILMCGTGVGFSVERQFVNQLPEVAEEFHPSDTTIVVADSKIGWATALREYIHMLYAGKIPKVDLSKLRPEGAPLKTFGGRSSGPRPLQKMLAEITRIFKKAAGRKLTSIECHDILCIIASCVVVGGVRRSALISLSNLTDIRMRNAKSGDFGTTDPQRYLANNSVAYTEKPDAVIFLDEWQALIKSNSGERGIFNRVAAAKKVAENGRREPGYAWGTNPCGEIILRPNGLCNLSEVVVRAEDSLEDLKRKVRIATIIGTFQSTLTNFRYVRKVWQRNAEEERLLGVSLTGIMDNELLNGSTFEHLDMLPVALGVMKNEAIRTNQEWAEKLGIPVSAAITTVKPSGTVSQLVNSSSGIHPRFAPYYIRNVRNSVNDPISAFLIASGVPHATDVTNDRSYVFSFPQRAPEGAICTRDVSAIQQLEHYLIFKKHWCEHNPSITVYVKPEEWVAVGAWVYEHFDDIGGVSFLPIDDSVYDQKPYEEITKEQYEAALALMPEVDWDMFMEKEDNVTGAKELACVAGYCEI
jgi:ribonucleoside-triphosphate reductase